MGIAIVWKLRKIYGEKFKLDGVNHLLKNGDAMLMINSADDWNSVAKSWEPELEVFKRSREKYFLYE